jgi:HK97 family phage portal protein
MSLITRAGAVMQRALGWQSSAGWSIVRGTTPTEYQRSGREVRFRGWERHPVVNACVRAVVDIVAAVDIEVYRKRADGTAEVIANHEAAHLLNVEPRIGATGHALRARTGVLYLTYGNTLCEIERNGRRGRPAGLRVIHPEQLQHVMVNLDDQIEEFLWNDSQGRQHRSRAEDILHFKDLTASEDGLFGYPRAASALQDVAADAEATQYVRQVVTNHGVPGLAVKTKGYKKQADLDAAEEKFNDKMLARGGRGGAYFINADEVEFEQIGFNLQELEFPDLRAIAREDICAAFGVDPRIIGLSSASNDSGLSGVQYREARFRLIQQTVIPMMKAVESELNRWFMPEYGDVYCRFSPDVLSEMTEDEAATSTRVIAEVQAKIRTIEEARETVGLTAQIDPSHHFGGFVLTEAGVALEQAAISPADQARELAAANGDTKAPPPGQRALPAPIVTRIAEPSPEQRTALWRAFDTRATNQETPFVRIALHLFAHEQDLVARILDEIGGAQMSPAIRQGLVSKLIETYRTEGEVYRLWVSEATPVIEQAIERGISDIADQIAADLSAENPRARAAIRRRANRLAGNVTDTTYEQIRGLLLIGQDQGLTVQRVGDLINEVVFEGQAPARSRTIARTETIGGLNEGAYVGAVVGGVMRSKSWLSQRDGRVRDSHTLAEGQRWIPLTQAFSNGLQYPGDPSGGPEEVINCRCTCLFSDEEKP